MPSLKTNLFSRKPIQLKEKLHVLQKGETLIFCGELSQSDFIVKELWIKSREADISEGIKVEENKLTGNKFRFDFEIKDLIKKIKFLECDNYFDYYIKFVRECRESSLKEIEKYVDYVITDQMKDCNEYFIRCGRFKETEIQSLEYVEYGDVKGICYLTLNGNISFMINKELSYPIKVQIDRLKSYSNSLKIAGKIFTKGNKIIKGTLIAKNRDSATELQFPAAFTWNKKETTLKFGLNRYTYTADLNLSSYEKNRGDLLEGVYDLYFKLTLSNSSEDKYVRIGRPTFKAKNFVKDVYAKVGEDKFIVAPYYTFKKSNLSMEVYKFDVDTFNYLQRQLKFAWLNRLRYKKKDVWLIGERPYKAQDTGYHFFKYMRENYPNKNVFYVINEDSPERKNVDPLGNILIFKSKEHIFYSLIATRIIGSHHPDYLYPVRTTRFKKAVKGIRVFLQHGVMGTKNMVANYGKNTSGFETDAFLVSSDFEKEMIIKDFGYKREEVFVTGLSRFDSLFENDIKPQKQLLIIPTWRDWLTTDDDFLESEYFQRYKELINHPTLHSIAEKNGLKIVFCLHPNMQKFTPYFKNAPVRVISQGEVDVQHLLKESSLMITDYSSVAFDFSFLYKPIIYYQFDRDRFIGKRPSHLDLDNDLPGDIVTETEQILDKVSYYISNNFKMKESYKKKADKFIKYRDQNASKRIYTVIKGLKKRNNYMRRSFIKELCKEIYRRFRKSRLYFPTMKVFYNVVRKVMPIKKDLIFFESGIGKQYADSPRYIYEKIIEQNLNYKKIWSLNKNMIFKDSNTKRVRRLSPQYYYYLARAEYWVNNQNFPTYIKKRKGTTYIQTWHGTPLKKMLFDIKNVQGREEGYKQRVYRATKNWDYLISPSEYATNAFKSAFHYDGKILEIGYPRNDLFYNEKQKETIIKVKRELKIPEGKKVILYAPTFRDNEFVGKNKFVFKIRMDLEELKKHLGNDYILLLRMHVVISNILKIPDELSDFVYNVSKYPDAQELLLISDILITDYSSIMFDYANTKRPILFFTYDLDEYKNETRGFYMNFDEEAPGPFLFTTADIIDSVKNIENIKTQYKDKYEQFRKKYCALEDGKATERVVNLIFESNNDQHN